ncbi:MAG TPA: helix-hairpin-helix domain-containing protein [Bacteroidia bacterium]
MKNVFRHTCLFVFIFLIQYSHAQVTPTVPNDDADNEQNQNLEILSEQNQDENADYTSLIENLKQYQAHPINLNNTDKDELMDLGLLTEIQVKNLLTHIEKNGRLISIYELQGIKGFDIKTIKRILPYVYVTDNFNSSHFTFSEMIKSGSIESTTRYQRLLEHQSGFDAYTDSALKKSPSKYYLGSPERIFTRLRFRYSNNVSVGFIAEKDAGEPFRRIDSLGKKAGFDYYSFHVFVRNIRFVKTMAIGDYQACFGQGLVLWRGFGFGKSIAVANMKRNATGFRPYSSVDENRFMRGFATTLKFGKIETSVFFSSKKIDANVQLADSSITGVLDAEEASSIILTGTHRTIGEIKDKDAITETIFGGNVSYKTNKLTIGATAQQFLLSKPLNVSDQLYNTYDFRGKSNTNVGVDFSYVFRNVNFYGEGAVSANGGKALTAGAIMALDPKFTMVAAYRNFDKKYQNLLALAISENTLPQNEQGLYIGAEAKLPKGFTFTTFFDQYKFPWLNYKASRPTHGYDFMAQLNWTPNKKTDMYFRYRKRIKEQDAGSEMMFDTPVDLMQENYRYNVSFQLLPYLKLRSRIEYVVYDKQNSKREAGSVMFQDVVFRKIGSPIEITARYGLFETDSYNSRVYTYENDVLYSFSIPALYDKGSRAYLMVDYTINKHIEVWARVAQTFYSNKTIQNEGSATQINKASKTELKLQVRLKF